MFSIIWIKYYLQFLLISYHRFLWISFRSSLKKGPSLSFYLQHQQRDFLKIFRCKKAAEAVIVSQLLAAAVACFAMESLPVAGLL